MLIRVECPDGKVFGPVRMKRFGNPETDTLKAEGQQSSKALVRG